MVGDWFRRACKPTLLVEGRKMLMLLGNLQNLDVVARDDEVGRVREFYFDDEQWVVRHFIVATSRWLGRDVLIAPKAVSSVDPAGVRKRACAGPGARA